MLNIDDTKIAIIGLGYVGLPLAVHFGRVRPTVGFDIDTSRVLELESGVDRTQENTADELSAANQLSFTTDIEALSDCNVYIVTVPTPIDIHRQPDLTPLKKASETVGRVLRRGDVVIYESTVYPGATEEDCVPILEAVSGLVFNRDFFAGYSPERINPGDKEHRLPTILKITSGSTPNAADFVDELYKLIIIAGTYKAPSIRVAEAAKSVENTQRDINIALINEISLIMHKLGIDTSEVLKAAGTKWNFLPFRPGLVGGHCIGVDPYYLTYKANSVGYHPEVILAGRRLNDNMGSYVASQTVKTMMKEGISLIGSRALVLGFAFKANCNDFRNTKIADVVYDLRDFGVQVDVYDPKLDAEKVRSEYRIDMIERPSVGEYQVIMLAVGHSEFIGYGIDGLTAFGAKKHVIVDLNSILEARDSHFKL